jgi:hypothetical protein
MIAVCAAAGFPVCHILNEAFQIIALLVYNPQVNALGIRFQCVLPLHAFRVRMNVVPVEKTHNIHAFPAKDFYRIDSARRAAHLHQDFQ